MKKDLPELNLNIISGDQWQPPVFKVSRRHSGEMEFLELIKCLVLFEFKFATQMFPLIIGLKSVPNLIEHFHICDFWFTLLLNYS